MRSSTFGALVGSVVGGFIPTLWGASTFDFSSLFLGALGAVVGIGVAFTASHG